ncbi:hypothetical protein JCM8208_001522 [Rhodotorula glutinis]
MLRRVKRSSSSPPPPPPPAVRPHLPPPTDDFDYDELDFLPSTSPPKPRFTPNKRPIPPPPPPAAARPTSRSSPRTTAAHSTDAPGLNTPSASPQAARQPTARALGMARRASDAAPRTRAGAAAPNERDLRSRHVEGSRRVSHGTRRSARTAGRDEQVDEGDVAEPPAVDEHDDAPSPAKRRRSGTLSTRKGLVFKAPDVALDVPRRARQRAEPHEENARASTSASPVKAASMPSSRVLVLDDDEEDAGQDEDELVIAPTRRIKPDPDGAPPVAFAVDPRPPPRARAAAPSAAPKPAHAPPSPSSALPSRALPLRAPLTSSSTADRAPPAAPTGPPTVPAFLLSLPLPSLARLSPLLHGLGLSSPLDLVQLAAPSPAARRARDKVLERVDAMDRVTRAGRAAADGQGEGGGGAGGVTAWERIVLEEELDEVWRKWGAGAAEGAQA